MGGGAHYPYPKEVWSPSGGWWSRPSNWRTNTAVCIAGIAVATYGVWRVSARNEYEPRWSPAWYNSSMCRFCAIRVWKQYAASRRLSLCFSSNHTCC